MNRVLYLPASSRPNQATIAWSAASQDEVAQEAVDLVGEHQLLEPHALLRQPARQIHRLVERTLRSSSPWISSTGDFHVAIAATGDDCHATVARLLDGRLCS